MTNPSRPMQTVDQSMKYIAWDIKQISKSLESLPEIARHLAALNFKLEGQKNNKSTTTPMNPEEGCPF